MYNLNTALEQYAQDTENANLNYNVALIYESIGQTAAAISYFLRAAERTNDNNLAYECLLKIGLCFERQGGRNNSVRGAYKHAVCLMPKRPEAYFLLSRYYERTQDHVDSYTTAELALQFADFNQVPLRSHVEYPGKYGIIFEKMVSSWWWGKPKETRRLLQVLKNEYGSAMDPVHYAATQNNLMKLGSGPESQAFRMYNKSMLPRMRFAFDGADTINSNYAQVYQDLFILSMLNGKRGGTYLEIGSAGPHLGNNTALLEQLFDWVGVGIEYDEKFIGEYRSKRKNVVLHQDALTTDYDAILKDLAHNGVVDYLQLDCEPAKTTYDIMLKIPFDDYKFAVITYEHDYYVDMTGLYRQLSRDFLKSKGYRLVANDISPDGISNFEDWWVHPDLIDANILRVMTDNSIGIKSATDYMFPQP